MTHSKVARLDASLPVMEDDLWMAELNWSRRTLPTLPCQCVSACECVCQCASAFMCGWVGRWVGVGVRVESGTCVSVCFYLFVSVCLVSVHGVQWVFAQLGSNWRIRARSKPIQGSQE